MCDNIVEKMKEYIDEFRELYDICNIHFPYLQCSTCTNNKLHIKIKIDDVI